MTDTLSDASKGPEVEAVALDDNAPVRSAAPPRLDAFYSIPVTVELVLASFKLPVSGLMDFQVGSEIDLDHQAGAEVALMVNGSRIAFGHLFLIDAQLRTVGVRISRLADTGEVT